jgi:hypothetical protein
VSPDTNRPSRVQPRRRPSLALLTNHPWAKLFSVVMAAIVVALIDREVEEVIFQGTMRVVDAPTGGRSDEVVVIPPPGFILVEDPAMPTFELTVRGLRKERSLIRLPLEAWLPAARLAGIGTDGPVRVGLEPRDIRLLGLGNPGVEVTPVSVSIARESSEDRLLEPVLIGRPPEGFDAVVELRPDRIRVTGPTYELRRMAKLPVEIDLSGATGTAPLTRTITEVPGSLRARGLRWPTGVEVRAEIRFEARDSVPFESRVRILLDRPLVSPHEFALDPPYDLEVYERVRFSGPRQLVEKLKDLETLGRFQERVMLVVEADRASAARQELLADGAWHTIEAPAWVPVNLLREFGLEPPSETLLVPVRVRRRQQ